MSSPLIRRELSARPGRWLLIGAAIAVAVTFTTAAFGFARSVRGLISPTSDSVSASLPQGSVVVTPRLSGLTTATALDASVLDAVRSVPGVLSASGSYDQPVAFRLRSGEGPDRPPVLRGVVFSSTTSQQWELVDGRFPVGPQEVALDAGGLAVAASFVGDVRLLQVPIGTLEVAIVGEVRPLGSAPSPTGNGDTTLSLAQATAVLDPEWAPALLDAEGRVDRITVIPQPGVAPETIAQAVRRAVPAQLQVVAVTSPRAVQQAAVAGIDEGIAAVTLGYAVLTMLVGALIVANALHVVVAQRTRELALLRAVGARRAQILRLVLGEATVVSALATSIGLLVGVWLGQLGVSVVRPDAPRSFAVTGPIAAAALGVGFGMGVGAAVLPAWRAGQVAPLDAMSDARGGADRAMRWTPVLAGLAGGSLAVWAWWSAWVEGGVGIAVGLVGAAVLLVAIAGSSRVVVAPLASLAGRVVTPVVGVTARLGLGNASRQPSRTAGAASTLMVGLALTAAVAVVGASARAAIADQVGAQTGVDLYAQRRGVVRVSARTVDEILGEERSGATRHVTLIAVDGVVVGDATVSLPATAVDLPTLAGIIDLDIVSGAMPARSDDAVVLVSERVAERDGVVVGSPMLLRSTSGQEAPLRVAAVFRDTSFVGPVVVARGTAESIQADGTFEQAAMRVWTGAPFERVQRRIDRSLAWLPKVAVSTPAQWAALQTTVVDRSLRVIAVLLAGAIAMGLAGLTVTQGLSVVERRRELQLLWSVGAARRQLRSMIGLEAVFVAAMASAVGLVVGSLLGWVALSAAPEALAGRVVVPTVVLGVVALLAVAAAWLVSRVVARRTLGR